MSSREESIFTDAIAHSGEQRSAFLDRACGENHALRQRVGELIAAHEASGGLSMDLTSANLTNVSLEKAGDTIGRYKLLQKIGEGGCGVVWMAEQEVPLRRRVALKVIKLGMDTKAVITRFEAERQALAMMDHPNIARVFDGGATETGRPFFVMELVRGIPVTRFCDEANLATAERLQLFVQVCQAVQHAHQKGIIHRDLKPSNILVTTTDGVTMPKVIDFGIAKATQGRLTNATLFTAFEQFIGTPAYMSPEQAELSSVEVDVRSDIYSLGVLLYELLIGRPPFDPQAFAKVSVDQIRIHIRKTEPPRPSRRLQTFAEEERTNIARLRGTAPAQLSILLRGDLDWIVMRCLEKDRSRRYESALALAKDIQRHLDHEPVCARPPSAPYVLQKFVRRNRVGFGVAGLCVVALVSGVGLSRWQAVGGRLAGGADAPQGENTNAVPSIAVIPFTNLSDKRENEYFCEGVSQELCNVFAKIPNLRVAATTSAALHYKGKNITVTEIARQLGVTYVVEGSVLHSDESVRINVRLINAATGTQIWSAHFDKALRNIFALQDEIAREIAENLELKLGRGPRSHRLVNPEAYQYVLEGRHHWNLRNEEGFARAEAAFEKAIAIDPWFAEAHAGLAEVSVTRVNFRQFDDLGGTSADLSRAKVEAQRAIELDPLLAEPHAALGFVARLDGQLAEAERHFQKALTLNSSSAAIYNWYALLLACRGKLEESLAAYARASSLDPLWFINLHRQAWHLARAGRHVEALDIARRAAALHTDVHIPNRADQAVLLYELGLVPEAVAAARLVTRNLDKQPRWQADSDAIWILRMAGYEREAEEHARYLFEKWAADSYNRGFVLGALGRFEDALPFLERTPAAPARGLYWDRMWDQWRNDPRFLQLMRKLGRLEDYNVARATLDRIVKQAESTKHVKGRSTKPEVR